MRQGAMPRLETLPPAVVAAVLLAATAGCAADVPDPRQPQSWDAELLPFASSPAPLSTLVDIAIVSEEVVCTTNSYESQLHCVDRTDGAVTTFGREGEGPGEFDGLTGIERGPDGQVVAMDFGAARMTFFEPDGTLVSEVPLPPLFQPSELHGDRLFGFKLGMLDFSSLEDLPDYVPMAASANSGEILWQRTDMSEILDRECFTGAVGTMTPGGGLVFEVCGQDLAFLADGHAETATVVASPNYAETLPSDRDVSDHLETITGVGRHGGAISDSVIQVIVAEFREKPKDWILKPDPFAFDDQGRLWVATTHDREALSYFDVWTDTDNTGFVRVRDRLLGFDIFGSTLVTLVEREPVGLTGVGEWGIDWYDLGKVTMAGH